MHSDSQSGEFSLMSYFYSETLSSFYILPQEEKKTLTERTLCTKKALCARSLAYCPPFILDEIGIITPCTEKDE